MLRRFLSLDLEEASFGRRGFSAPSDGIRAEERRRHLERIGRTFIVGYNAALRERDLARLADRLDGTPAERRGFAYEGAAMALALLDLLLPFHRLRELLPGSGGKRRFDRFLEGPGRDHLYMLHVGAGWALARLRRGVDGHLGRHDPALGWLAADGYGFHEGYFHPDRYLPEAEPGEGTPGNGEAVVEPRARDVRSYPRKIRGYARRVFDQGLGRSLWFSRGADPEAIGETIARLEGERAPDLWSGVGLAAAYAGGVPAETLERLRDAAGPEAGPHLAQGAAFAATARERAGNPAPHTAAACRLLAGVDPPEALALTDAALEEAREPGRAAGGRGAVSGSNPAGGRGTGPGAPSCGPVYERWRASVRQALASAGGGKGRATAAAVARP